MEPPSNLIVFCGAPASGKTTMSKKLAEQYDAVYYSFDEMKCLQHCELIPRVKKSLEQGKDVVVDSTYSTRVARTQLIEAIKYINCNKILIYMNTSLDECIRRNAQRQYPLQQYMVEGIHKSIQPPSLEEGWNEIIYI